MKKSVAMISTIFLISVCAAVQSFAEVVSSRLPAKIHVIQNFEGWNDVLIRFTGVLKNSCYSKEATTVKVEGDQIYIENLIKFSESGPCLMVLMPYSDQIAVRELKEGTYDVSVMDKFGKYQEMTSFKTE